MKNIFNAFCLLFLCINMAQADKLVIGTYAYIIKYKNADLSSDITFKWCYRLDSENKRQGLLYTSYGVIPAHQFNTNERHFSTYPPYAVIAANGVDSESKPFSVIIPENDNVLSQVDVKKMLDEGKSTSGIAMSSAIPLLINLNNIDPWSRAPIMAHSSMVLVSATTQHAPDSSEKDEECVDKVGKLLRPGIITTECKTSAGKSGKPDNKGNCILS